MEDTEGALSKEEADILHRSTKKQKGQGADASPGWSLIGIFALVVRRVILLRGRMVAGKRFPVQNQIVMNLRIRRSPLFYPLCPVVILSKEERKRICSPWKRVVIVKLLGRRISLRMLNVHLSKLWQPKSGMEVIDLENEYFFIKFKM
ncbi:hypothetical protein SESBI_46977 [Sesbania bispinosa]|nr:hypothetical protein SESBI_46977 [Sesbania bispinosa]